ncbi:hypothetical protein FA95DRAFT_1553847 [Auriscalpium vulgare]|uniref:Uncharacterized protein n=1 Tax=Auriscalpium vulgare TaxID=40419 RepID=A0ACB8S6P3_9AGAM|nr:hypothetical protein FA95DRAFT_1553847 [Auriscalpium vulgare]
MTSARPAPHTSRPLARTSTTPRPSHVSSPARPAPPTPRAPGQTHCQTRGLAGLARSRCALRARIANRETLG